MARKTLKAKSELTLDQIDDLLKQVGQLNHDIGKKEVEADVAIKKIKAQTKDAISDKQKQVKELDKKIKAYIDAHPEMFQAKRSIALNFGKIGKRKGSGALKTLKGMNWKKALETIKASRAMKQFVVSKKVVDKNAIIAAIRNKQISLKVVESCGIGFDDSEKPFYEVFDEKIVNTQEA